METRSCFIVIEDDGFICSEYREKTKSRDNLYLIDTTGNAKDGLKMVLEYDPDAVVLDIELNDGEGTGITFLEDLKAACPGRKPLILVVTNITSSFLHNLIRAKGGDMIITKTKSDYNIDFVLDTLESLASRTAIENNRRMAATQAIAKAEFEKKRKNRIINEMELLGVKPNVKGFKYLCDAIELYCDGQTDKLAQIIADKYRVSADSADKAMRHAIITAWNRDKENFMNRYSGYIDKELGLPHLMSLIAHYAEKIQKDV